jgi:elongation factor P--(R)-beta-lysine ligase
VHLESLRVVDDVSKSTQGLPADFAGVRDEAPALRGCAGHLPGQRVYRAGERGRRHNPEFTMVEWYRLGMDQHALMRDVEVPRAFAARCTQRVRAPPASSSPIRMHLREYWASIRCRRRRKRNPCAAIESTGIPIPHSMRASPSRDDLLDLAMGTLVAESFPCDRLTFVYDFPASQAALARIHGPVAARFEAFWGAAELANGFHELGAADEQLARFRN